MDFSYATRVARITSLSDERSPQSYDLCANHADRTSPPHGWELRDDREEEPEVVPTSPEQLDSPRTVAVLAAALRGRPTEDPSPTLEADPLREALEELQAVAAPSDEAPTAEPRLLRLEPEPDVEEELDLVALAELLVADDAAEAPQEPTLPEQIALLSEAIDEVAAEPDAVTAAPGRPVLAHRTRDDGRATRW
jgi:hypothetical protein